MKFDNLYKEMLNLYELKELNEETIQEVDIRKLGKKAFLGGLLTLSTLFGKAEDSEKAMDKVLNTMVELESGGNLKAIGDQGKSWGGLQIQQGYIDDVNRVYGTNYTHEDAFDIAKAKEITKLYLKHYGKHKEKKTGKRATLEDLMRIHNGGPDGWKEEDTEDYWEKFKKIFRRKYGK